MEINALKTLIDVANLAQSKGVLSLEEAAITFNSVIIVKKIINGLETVNNNLEEKTVEQPKKEKNNKK